MPSAKSFPVLLWTLLAVVLVDLAVIAGPAAAQTPASQVIKEQTATAPSLPEALSPELIDGFLARLTDAEIRAVLKDELDRQAAVRAAADDNRVSEFTRTVERLETMRARIAERGERWAVALGSLGDRRDRVVERLGLASAGLWGMLAAAIAVAATGLGAAFFVGWLTRHWRAWLQDHYDENYWETLLRAAALLLLELAPIGVFVAATNLSGMALAAPLGPLTDYLWIYHAGVSAGWAFITVVRRVFSPDAPHLKLSALDSQAGTEILVLTRQVVILGVAGWLFAGLFPVIGLGFPPAMVTVAAAGTVATILMLVAILRCRKDIQFSIARLLPEGAGARTGGLILTVGGPVLAAVYVLIAYVYWVSQWLESGTQHLVGPAGTLVVVLLLPMLDRLGPELVRSTIRATSPSALRYRAVLSQAFRVILGIATIGVITRLWGFDIWTITKGPGAPLWAGALWDIAFTLLIALFAWRLIRAAFYRDRRGVSGEDVEDSAADTAGTRLDTLVPLARNVLLFMLGIVVVMIVLSALGVDIGPLLASAGIVGIAIGFGAQTLVRDIFSGAFFLIDDAFRVGEYIELDQDLRGEVEAITIRSLQLRHHRGPVVTVPFGELKSITNHNRDWVIYKMNFRMEPETDPQQFKKLVKGVGAEFLAHEVHGPKFLEPLKSQGVYYIDDDSAMVFRVKFKCRPRAQFVLRREIYHRLRQVFAENGLILARRKVEVVSGDDSGAAEAVASGGGAAEAIATPLAARPAGA
ncbi:MAG: mechanosensitive ion channel family protein [Pseudomonadota bacterium]